jgi:predicted nuclease of predicted toxin-antitoxin system
LPSLKLVRVRSLGKGRAPDAEILAWAATESRIVLSHDARSMPRFARERLRDRLPLAGLVIVPQKLGTGAAIDDLEILAVAG